MFNIYIEQEEIERVNNAKTISNRIKFFLDDNRYLSLRKGLITQIQNYSKEINCRIIVIDTDQMIRADSGNIYNEKISDNIQITKSLKGDSSIKTYESEEGHTMYISTPIYNNTEIVGATLIIASLNDIYSRIEQIRRIVYVISLSSIFFVAIISFVFAVYFSRPIKKFTEAVKKMANGDLSQTVNINTNDEFKQLATAFNMMSTKLEQVDEQRKNFVANVSHELKTPLSSIKLLSEGLLHQNETDVKIYREFLKDIDSEIDRLNKIIEDLLSHVDLDKEKLKLNLKLTYINFLVEKIIGSLKPLANKKNINITFIADEKIQIKVDADKIRQAVINIIHNAIKYTPQNGNVEIKLYKEKKDVVIQVKDNGYGIPESSINHIFERFYRVDKARSRNTGGTGLGLSIAKQIVLLHQGSIEVESKIGKGTTFYIRIPKDISIV